jgi:hypothetical protein
MLPYVRLAGDFSGLFASHRPLGMRPATLSFDQWCLLARQGLTPDVQQVTAWFGGVIFIASASCGLRNVM